MYLCFWQITQNTTQPEISAKFAEFAPGIASVAVDFLVSNGYLLRQSDDIDRRIWRLLITEKSAPIIQEGRAVQQEFGKRLTHGISEEELAAYTQIIQKFKENILAITHNKKGELL